MIVTAEIHKRVIDNLAACIVILEAKYKQKFPMPKVVYDKRGTTAGTAIYREWKINLNPGLLMDPRHTDEMVNDTVPHELGHLVTFKVYPETMDTNIIATRRGWKRTKREVHGPHWKEVMWAMGANPSRCHDMDTSAVKVVKSNSRQDQWKCSRCAFILLLTPKKSERLRADPHAVFHRGCRGAHLIDMSKETKEVTVKEFAHELGLWNAFTHAPISGPMHANNVQATTPVSTSKLDKCWELFKRNPGASRQMMIAMFVSAGGCTSGGAATYFTTLKKRYEAGVL